MLWILGFSGERYKKGAIAESIKLIFSSAKSSLLLRGKMSHRKWSETKQQPSRAMSGHQLSCRLVCLHFLCDIPSSHAVVNLRSFKVQVIGCVNSSIADFLDTQVLLHFTYVKKSRNRLRDPTTFLTYLYTTTVLKTDVRVNGSQVLSMSTIRCGGLREGGTRSKMFLYQFLANSPADIHLFSPCGKYDGTQRRAAWLGPLLRRRQRRRR